MHRGDVLRGATHNTHARGSHRRSARLVLLSHSAARRSLAAQQIGMAGLAAREAALRGVRKALGSSASTNRAQCNKRAGASASGVRACIADGFSGRACSRRAAARVHAASADAAASFDLPESWTAPPVGFNVYETMCIYNPEVPDAER